MSRFVHVAIALAAFAAPVAAQPVVAPEPSGPLAQVRDDKQLAETLSAITQDPAIAVDNPATRSLAQALMVEGVKQLQAKSYDQALANFLEAYTKFPSPKILLNIASTLRDMGRLADAANTYQRYLLDPATGAERVAEVKELLLRLDEQLTILTVRVFPSGSDVSIDAGPFIPVGSSLLTRVRSGIHLVRVRKDKGANEVTVNGFEGENKEVSATVTVAAVDPDPTPTPTNANPTVKTPTPEHVDGWLITGTQYSADSGTGRERKVRSGYSGPVVSAIVPRYEATSDGGAVVHYDDDESISSGVIAAVRIDGEGRGFAGAIGLAISKSHLEAELMFLKSDSTGGYLGLRYRLFTSWMRPYVGVGMPGFAYKLTNAMTNETSTKLAVGLRAAIGVELRINGHLSVQGDIGYEHFFVDPEETHLDANIFVPTLGVIGRL
jgi:Outer membrane protein beta-barrel domain